MRFIILVILFVLPVLGFSQSPNHIFFGINLNLDWYSLTNISKLTYDEVNEDELNKNPLIFTDIDYYLETAELHPVFEGIDEFVVGFQRMENPDLNLLKPEMFLARIKYSPEEYDLKGKNDALRILTFVKNNFGDAELNMVRDEYSTYKWGRVNFDIVLTTRKDDLMTTLMYFKK